jgi:hypothetical protein
MEAASPSETMASCSNTTRRHNPENLNLNLHRRENLKSRIDFYFLLSLLAKDFQDSAAGISKEARYSFTNTEQK